MARNRALGCDVLKNDDALVEASGFMVTSKRDWNWEARLLLKRELDAAGVSYTELSEALLSQGLCLSRKVVANKVNRGTFTMAFFLRCMAALKVDEVKLGQGAAGEPSGEE